MDIKLVASAVEAYKDGASDSDASRLDFFQKMYELVQKRADLVAGSAGYKGPATDAVKGLYSAGMPLFSQAPVDIDPALFAETLSLVGKLLADEAGLSDRVVAGLRAYDWNAFCEKADLDLAGKNPPAFIEECLQDLESFGISADIPASVFATVCSFALRAHVQSAAEQALEGADVENWRQVFDQPVRCPVCGSPATASFVSDSAGTDGRGRMQYCSVCGTEWPFERIRCGMCGSTNGGHLHYFHIEGDSAHRIQKCDDCGQYERVVFPDDNSAPLCMEVEDVVMAKLDQVALDPRFRS